MAIALIAVASWWHLSEAMIYACQRCVKKERERRGRRYRSGSSELVGCLSELGQGRCLQFDTAGGGDGEIEGEGDEIVANSRIGIELLAVVGKRRCVDPD